MSISMGNRIVNNVTFLGFAAATVDSPSNWREKAKPIKPGSTYPAKDHCRYV